MTRASCHGRRAGSDARYTPSRIEEGACLLKFATPAWSSSNLLNVAKYVESGLVFAHVRAASDGNMLTGNVNYENTHPFKVRFEVYASSLSPGGSRPRAVPFRSLGLPAPGSRYSLGGSPRCEASPPHASSGGCPRVVPRALQARRRKTGCGISDGREGGGGDQEVSGAEFGLPMSPTAW